MTSYILRPDIICNKIEEPGSEVIITQPMETALNPSYNCSHCGRSYTRKYYYDRHAAACSLLQKSTRERAIDREEQDDTPTLRELYELVIGMANKMQKLESELTTVRQWTDRRKRTLNVVDWLNDNYAEGVSYEVWLSSLSFGIVELEIVFKYDYIGGIGHILQSCLPLDEEATLPVKAFEQKENALFIRGEGGWRMMTTGEFESMVSLISKRLLDQFVVWQERNKAKLTQERFAEEYAGNVQKVIGGNFPRDKALPRIRRALYKYLRLNLRNIVQYEFTYQ